MDLKKQIHYCKRNLTEVDRLITKCYMRLRKIEKTLINPKEKSNV